MDPYRVAYEQAMTELNEITRKFDLLRLQKAQVENLIMRIGSHFVPIKHESVIYIRPPVG